MASKGQSESVRYFVCPIDRQRKADERSTVEQIIEFEHSALTEWQLTAELNDDPAMMIASEPLVLLNW